MFDSQRFLRLEKENPNVIKQIYSRIRVQRMKIH